MHGADQLIQVRLIGPLEVIRADGTAVQPGEWRTAKTRDLFRLLVLEEGRPVRTERLLAALWPDVDRNRGAASLRTAASRIRMVVGSSCIVREGTSLALRGASSDVAELTALVSRLRGLQEAGRPETVLEVVAPHARLLEGELHAEASAHFPGEDTWAEDAHARVTALQRDLLTLQAECAAAVGRLGEAVELSVRAIERDPFWERPYRVMMRALADQGEADQALRSFERLRSTLANDLGVEPSPRSFAVRDEILRDMSTGARHVPAVPAAAAAASSGVLRIPAQPGWGGSFEQYVLRWLRDRASGATVRIQASLVGDPRQVFALDVTSGLDGLIELVEAPGRLQAPPA